MKQCAICGQPAERGSKCFHCRAAIKRARDETVSQFQPAPALALASGGHGPGMSHPRPTPLPAKPRRVVPPGAGGAATPITLRAERLPGRAHASPFVWIMVVMMVLVAIFVSAGVINAALEAARGPQSAAAAADSLPVPATLPAVASRSAAPVLAPLPRQLPPSTEVQEAVDARMTGARVPRDTPVPGRPVSPRPGTTSAPAESVPAAVATSPPKVEVAAEPARVAAAPVAAAKARANPRPDRWERLDTALRACAGQDFFGRVMCEQKARFEYCEGFWGQKPQCPGSPVNDHGQ